MGAYCCEDAIVGCLNTSDYVKGSLKLCCPTTAGINTAMWHKQSGLDLSFQNNAVLTYARDFLTARVPLTHAMYDSPLDRQPLSAFTYERRSRKAERILLRSFKTCFCVHGIVRSIVHKRSTRSKLCGRRSITIIDPPLLFALRPVATPKASLTRSLYISDPFAALDLCRGRKILSHSLRVSSSKFLSCPGTVLMCSE